MVSRSLKHRRGRTVLLQEKGGKKEQPEGKWPGLPLGRLDKGQLFVAQNQGTVFVTWKALSTDLKRPTLFLFRMPHFAWERKQSKNTNQHSEQAVANLTCQKAILIKVLYTNFCGLLNLIFIHDHCIQIFFPNSKTEYRRLIEWSRFCFSVLVYLFSLDYKWPSLFHSLLN